MSAKLFNRYLRYLGEVAQTMREEADRERENWKYQSFEEAILACGSHFLEQDSEMTQFIGLTLFNNQCYKVCKGLALSDSNLTYCEAYAVAEGMNSTTPLRHAWLINKNGKVFDPTWGTVGVWYYGVPFETNWVKEIWKSRAINDSEYDRSIFQANYLERHSILRSGIPQSAIVTP